MNFTAEMVNRTIPTFPHPAHDVEVRLYAGKVPLSIDEPLQLRKPVVTVHRRLSAAVATIKLAILERVHPDWFGCPDPDHWGPVHPRVEQLEEVARIDYEPKHRLLASLLWDAERELYTGYAAKGTATFIRVFDRRGVALVQVAPTSDSLPSAACDGDEVAIDLVPSVHL